MTLDDQIVIEYKLQLQKKLSNLNNLLNWSENTEIQKEQIEKEIQETQNLYDALFINKEK